MTKSLILAICLTLSAWAGAQQVNNSDELYIRASALTKLSAAVEQYVRYEAPGTTATGEALLKEATKHDPALLQNLTGYAVLVQSKNRHAVLLVCTEDQKVGLLEDAGCTGQMDKHLWTDGQRPCMFTLDIAATCSGH